MPSSLKCWGIWQSCQSIGYCQPKNRLSSVLANQCERNWRVGGKFKRKNRRM